MLETIQPAPPDAILGLTDAYQKDSNPNKVNLGVGVYKDANGRTPILDSVKEAERRILDDETTKSYLPIDGAPAYAVETRRLLFGDGHALVDNGRAVTAQTPGGTGALRVAADFIAANLPGSTVWVSNPTWANHPNIFEAAGLSVNSYPYFDVETNGVRFGDMLTALRTIPANDVVLLHACCHNPTGVDLSEAQWAEVAETLSTRGLLPLLDFAYQGFGDGLREDAAGLLTLAEQVPEFLVANSFSKNFGLYRERIGALTVVAENSEAAQAALSHVKQRIRANYSNPPAHGSAIVTTILTDAELRAQWEGEVTQMRNRIQEMRDLFVETLNEKGVERDFSFIARQRGMFSYSGLTKEQVERLRKRHGVYIVGSGRINVAGMTAENMDYLCEAIADVLG